VKSDVKERPPVARGGGSGTGAVGREVALEGGGGESVTREWTRGSRLNGLGRRRGREGKRRGEAGAVMGPGPDRWAVPGSGPRPAGVRDVRCAIVAGRTEDRRRGLTGGPRHSAGWRCR
jgi:hypothetical protein